MRDAFLVFSIILTIVLLILVFYSVNSVITSYRAELKEKNNSKSERSMHRESLFDHFQKKLKVMS